MNKKRTATISRSAVNSLLNQYGTKQRGAKETKELQQFWNALGVGAEELHIENWVFPIHNGKIGLYENDKVGRLKGFKTDFGKVPTYVFRFYNIMGSVGLAEDYDSRKISSVGYM